LQQKILNILSFLSQSVLQKKDLFYDAEEIWEGLSLQGYTEEEIESALMYIEKNSLRLPGPYWSSEMPSHRIFTPEEENQMSAKARGYLWSLKSRGVIDHGIEDEIVHKAMNLDCPAGLREIKTVAALTIFGYEHQCAEFDGSSSSFSHPKYH